MENKTTIKSVFKQMKARNQFEKQFAGGFLPMKLRILINTTISVGDKTITQPILDLDFNSLKSFELYLKEEYLDEFNKKLLNAEFRDNYAGFFVGNEQFGMNVEAHI